MQKLTTYLVAGLLLCLMGIIQACKKDKIAAVVPFEVKSYYPNSGNAGTLVTITGSGFSDGKASISFNGTDAEVLSTTDTLLVVRAPEKGQSGTVTFSNGSKSLTVGEYTYQKLSVQKIFPPNGTAGTQIRISGAGFSSLKSPVEVLINGKSATVVSASDTSLVATVPEGAGSGPVTVKVDGMVSVGQPFQFQTISSIKPLTGGQGTRVTISGEGFAAVAADNVVEFNGKKAVVAEVAVGKLVAIAPEGLTSGPLAVTINGQKIVGPSFTVVPPPSLRLVSPLSGPAGAEMIIDGKDFSTVADENVVTINNVKAVVKEATNLRLTVVLPAGMGKGTVMVSVNDQPVKGPEFTEQNLGILKMEPASGLAGTKVVITGTGFSVNPAENEVTFNGVVAQILNATATTLEVMTPANLTTGPVKVKRAALVAESPVPFSRSGLFTLTNQMGAFIGPLVVDRQGNVFVSNTRENYISKVTPAGDVSIFAGEPNERGVADGNGRNARLGNIYGLVLDENDNIYVSEVSNNGGALRKITPQGEVTTLKSGLPNDVGSLTRDKKGNLYYTQLYRGVFRVYPNGISENVFPRTAEEIRIAISNNNDLFVVGDKYEPTFYWQQLGNNKLTWVGSSVGYQDGPVSSALFGGTISSLLLDHEQNLLIADAHNYALRKLDLSTGQVSTAVKLSKGFEDGSLDKAKIGLIADLAIDKDGTIYISDPNNRAIRKIVLK
ncbi:IPT/TIG domain-containing protein [Chitinophaga eiseniae]|uniref:IPT/TIG domain-containing protein n=1 Tax=Chitinophaga eiseniae TaxID=634771 RepID=A0A1T4QJ49_9BACT|nr:IPT/TIG domain-containing protein [Chitinophaga eiseniae]SKA03749.1 IPT/TIG domain-containing protein [Chitinophaga eiseniae]